MEHPRGCGLSAERDMGLSQCKGLECRDNVVVWKVHLFNHAHLLPSFRDRMGQYKADACLYSAPVAPFPFLLQTYQQTNQRVMSGRKHGSPVAAVRMQSCFSYIKSAHL